jgi:hypothetical protein
MSDERQRRIERRAHEIWQREGRPEGRADQHWRLATAEIDEEDAAAAVTASALPVPEVAAEPQPAAAVEAADRPTGKASSKRTSKPRAAAGAKADVAGADEAKKTARKKK